MKLLEYSALKSSNCTWRTVVSSVVLFSNSVILFVSTFHVCSELLPDDVIVDEDSLVGMISIKLKLISASLHKLGFLLYTKVPALTVSQILTSTNVSNIFCCLL